jgi:hypothetical protein
VSFVGEACVCVCWGHHVGWRRVSNPPDLRPNAATLCSFVFIQPNFMECWWDHWILDFALCNMAGIVLGHMILR